MYKRRLTYEEWYANYLPQKLKYQEKERKRLLALNGIVEPEEEEIKKVVVPPARWVLECTTEQANEIIKTGERPIMLLFQGSNGTCIETEWDAYDLEEGRILTDINGILIKKKGGFFIKIKWWEKLLKN